MPAVPALPAMRFVPYGEIIERIKTMNKQDSKDKMKRYKNIKFLFELLSNDGASYVQLTLDRNKVITTTNNIKTFLEGWNKYRANPEKNYYPVLDWTGNLSKPIKTRSKHADVNIKTYAVFDLDVWKFNQDDKHFTIESIKTLAEEFPVFALREMKGLDNPYFVVYSGGGVHVYYKLNTPLDLTTKANYEAYLITYKSYCEYIRKQISSFFGINLVADDKPGAPGHLIRLPYSWNAKPEYKKPIKSEIVYINPDARCTAFDDYLHKSNIISYKNDPSGIPDNAYMKPTTTPPTNYKFDVNKHLSTVKSYPMVKLFEKYKKGKMIKTGNTEKIHCLWHDDEEQSLCVNHKYNTYKCFGCGSGGDTIDFVKKVEGLEFVQAVKFLTTLN